MTRRFAQILIVMVLAGVVCGPSFAQRRRHGERGATRGGEGVMDEGTAQLLFTALLNLNDNQQTELKQILREAVMLAKPIQTQINASQTQLLHAAKTGQPDAAIQKLADQQGIPDSKMAALQAETFAKICKMLTSGQNPDPIIYDQIHKLLADSVDSSPPPYQPATGTPHP